LSTHYDAFTMNICTKAITGEYLQSYVQWKYHLI